MKRHILKLFVFLGLGVSALGVDNPIDPGDPDQVLAQEFVDLSLAEALALVPTQIPLICRGSSHGISPATGAIPSGGTITVTSPVAKCPACSGTTMSWVLADPDHMTCADCSVILPSATYPENATLTLDTWEGKSVNIPYHNDGMGGAYYFKGVIDSCKQRYLYGALDVCEETYAATGNSTRFADRMRDVYLRYTEVLDNWVCAVNKAYVAYDTTKSSQSLFPDEWGHRYSFTLPSEFFDFYTTIYDDTSLDLPVDVTIARERINTEFFRRFLNYKLSYPESYGVFNNLGTDVRGMMDYGLFFQWPEAVHYASRWVQNQFDLYVCGYDGMSLEGPGYHYLWVASYLNVLPLVDWTDPVGYVDPVDGTNISEPASMAALFPAGKRNEGFAAAPVCMALPNGSPVAVHDNHGSITSLGQGGWHRIEKGTDESRNRIVPSFGQIVLGDGTQAKQVQSQLHFSQYGNHASHDSLTFQFYANERALFEFPGHQGYTRVLINKNGVVVNHRTPNVYKENIKGMVELYAPTLPGLSAVRAQRDTMVFSDPDKMQRYRRTLLQNTVSLDQPYVLDLFEATGGSIHEYLLHGSMFYEQSASANIALADPNPGDPTPFHTTEDDDAVWERFTSVQSGTIAGSTYVDFTYDDLPTQGARVHLGAMAGKELSLSRLETVEEATATADRPSLMIRNGALDPEKNDLVTDFVVLHEAFNGTPSVSSVVTTDLGNNCLAVQVTLAGRVDTYLISKDGPQAMAFGGFTANATIAAFSESTTNSNSDVWLIGGTQATSSSRSLTATQAEYEGQLQQVNRMLEGAAYDSFISDIALPEGRELAGQVLLVEGYDASTNKTFVNSYSIDEVVVDQATGHREIRLRHEPGLTLNGSQIEEIFFPHAVGTTHKVRLIPQVSSVPAIVNVTPGIPHWKPEAVQTSVGQAFDTSVSPMATVVPANAEVRFTTDGSEPDLGSPVLSGSVTFTNDASFNLLPENTGGITVPRVTHEYYYGSKPGLQGTSVSGGLEYDDGASQQGVVPNLRAETVSPLLSRHNHLDLTGYLHAPTSGVYRFRTRFDSDVSLTIDNQRIIHQIGLRSISGWEGEIYLEEGYHSIDLYYYMEVKPWFEIQWSGPGFEYEEIPDTALATAIYPDGATVPTNGRVLWLDANDLDGDGTSEGALESGLSGGVVSTWADKSGSGNHATQSGSSQPAFVASVLNGKPVVRCDGVDDYLNFPALSTIRTVFWVLKDDDLGVSGNLRPLLGHNSLYHFHRQDGALWHGSFAAPAIKDGTTWINRAVANGTAENLTAGYNQVSLITTANVSANNLAADRSISERRWFGDIAEVIIYDRALSEEERLAVENYLNQKWFNTVTYTAAENGRITGSYHQIIPEGSSSATVTALPDLGYHFVNWTGDVNSTNNPLTITNVTADLTLTANFAINIYDLVYTAGTNGTLSGTTPQAVVHGTSGTAVTAVADPGHHFVSWSDGRVDNPRIDAIGSGDITVTANFVVDDYVELTYVAGANGTISGTTPQSVDSGTSGTAVTAVPDTGYHFLNWSDLTAQNPRTDLDVTADITVTANFAIDVSSPYTYTWTGAIDGNWVNPGNWTGGILPSDLSERLNTIVVSAGGSNATINVPTIPASVGNISFTIQTGADLTINDSGWFGSGAAGGTSLIVESGATFTQVESGDLILNRDQASSFYVNGTWNINHTRYLSLGYGTGKQATIVMDGGTLNLNMAGHIRFFRAALGGWSTTTRNNVSLNNGSTFNAMGAYFHEYLWDDVDGDAAVVFDFLDTDSIVKFKVGGAFTTTNDVIAQFGNVFTSSTLGDSNLMLTLNGTVVTVLIAPDGDGDGMPIDWETAHGLDPNVNDADLDADLDGLSNYAEYRAGTDPQDPASVLDIVSGGPTDSAGTNFMIQWSSVAGKEYNLQQNTNLFIGSWNAIISNIPATAPMNSSTVNVSGVKSMFFKVEVK